jgi:hypothetical protein
MQSKQIAGFIQRADYNSISTFAWLYLSIRSMLGHVREFGGAPASVEILQYGGT